MAGKRESCPNGNANGWRMMGVTIGILARDGSGNRIGHRGEQTMGGDGGGGGGAATVVSLVWGEEVATADGVSSLSVLQRTTGHIN